VTDTSDERLKSLPDGLDLVGSRSARRDSDRAASSREVTQSREYDDEELLDRFRLQRHTSALPDLPVPPGYRVIWLTTQNPNDSIRRRMELGYEPIYGHEVPGMETAATRAGEYHGIVAINEMLAFKLPERLWQAYMNINHHQGPMEEEDKMKANADAMRAMAERDGVSLIEEEGYRNFSEPAPRKVSFN